MPGEEEEMIEETEEEDEEEGGLEYCTDTTNPATGIAENDDRRPAVLVMTDDCRVGRQIRW